MGVSDLAVAVPLPPPRRQGPRPFGRYTLRGRLASGGMADVYAAELEAAAGFRKRVAIKRMRPHMVDDESFVRMFLEEARLGSMLSHPKICEVYELSQVNGEYYIAMEYLHGVTLSGLVKACEARGVPLPVDVVVGIIEQACQGLHYAHERTGVDGRSMCVIHRDVSPQNLFIRSDGVVKVLDFGIAKTGDSSHMTTTGSLKGKDSYMSPEQLRGERLDCRSDIWSLGVVLFETLTGTRLFRRGSLMETVHAIATQPVPALRERCQHAPPKLDRVLARALSRDRDRRFGSAEEMRAGLIYAMGTRRPASEKTIARLVRDVCGDTLAERAALFEDITTVEGQLPAVSEDSAPMGLPSESVSLPAWDHADLPVINTDLQGTNAYPAASGDSEQAPVKVRRRGVPVVLLSSLVLGLACVAMWLVPALPGSDALPSTARKLRAAAASIAAQRSRVNEQVSTAGERSYTVTPVVAPLAAPVRQPNTAPPRVAQPMGAVTPPAREPDSQAQVQPDASAAAAEVETRPDMQARPRRSATRSRAARTRARKRRAAAKAARANTVAAEPGRMFVDADPYATVYLDGQKLGVTPILGKPVRPGTHTLRAVAADGRSRSLTVQVKSGEPLRKRIRW